MELSLWACSRRRRHESRMSIAVRRIESSHAAELYVTVTPTDRGRDIFGAISDLLREEEAWICQERVFAPQRELAGLREIRSRAYAGLNDPVEPAWLDAEDADGVMPGVQVHAIRAASRPQILSADGAHARLFEIDGCRWLTAGGLRAPKAGDAPAQARASFEKAEILLRKAGADLHAVARTWIFMDDILSWYDQFNEIRNTLFRERGILDPIGGGQMPASTGIGVRPADGARCSIDLFAVMGPNGPVQWYGAAGRQRSAYEYGSAFARAVAARTPGGRTVFVSGTAAIDDAGVTCCLNDRLGQIRMTLENVSAILRQLSVRQEDVVQAIAYCADPETQTAFTRHARDELPWPWLTMIGDVCRPDLFFEVEVTAAHSPS
jgi:enamine deaminase RidA (YjgF/YER057c/UK114 family)